MKKVVISIIVLILLAAAGVGVYAVTHPDKRAKPAASAQSQNAAQNTSSTPLIQTKTSATLGSYLTDSSGNTLYTYGADSQGVSTCSGLCLYDWPIYEAITTSNLPANITVIARSDGKKQYAYKGLPLYTFTQDAPGQITGDNVNDFHVAKP